MAAKGTAIATTDEGSLERTERLIRERAYRLYQERGCADGHDLDDWLQAEAEVYGRKSRAADVADNTDGISARSVSLRRHRAA